MGGADPDKVEVGEDPGQPEGQPPGDHDAQVGERQHREDGQADRDGLRCADYKLLYNRSINYLCKNILRHYDYPKAYYSNRIKWLR